MIQDISPKIFHNEYEYKSVTMDSVIFVFKEDMVLCNKDAADHSFPLYKELDCSSHDCIYLFEISGMNFFLNLNKSVSEPRGFAFEPSNIFRTMENKSFAFAGMTAYHLYRWYGDNRFCGRCGTALVHDTKERMLSCPKCENMVYPRINPAIIVGLIHEDKILLTKYAGRAYARYALVAGFVEIGETAEEAVRREVMEEVGVKVKNIRYYKSQPWGFSGSLLLGYFADLDGKPDIILDEEELSEAIWVEREEIMTQFDDFSLTNDMICHFKDGYE